MQSEHRFLRRTITAATCLAALVGTSTLTACGLGASAQAKAESKQTEFVLGGLFPETGSLSCVAPAQMAVFKLVAKDINDSGDVLGTSITTTIADVSDADHADQNIASLQSVLAKKSQRHRRKPIQRSSEKHIS